MAAGRAETRVSLYYEVHVTIEPVFEPEKLERLKSTVNSYGYRIAELLMQKRKEDKPERSKYDTFVTGRGIDLDSTVQVMKALVCSLTASGFKVWRYKVEDAVIDSNISDTLLLL